MPLAQLVESFLFEGDFFDHLGLIPARVAEQVKVAQAARQHQRKDREPTSPQPALSSGRRSVSTRQVSTGFEDGSFADSTLDDPILADGNTKAPFHPSEATIGRVQQLDTSLSSTHTNNPFALSYNQIPSAGPAAAQLTGLEVDKLGSSTSANSLNGADSNFATGSTEVHTLTADESDYLASPAPARGAVKHVPAKPSLPAVVEADELTATSAGPLVSNPLVFHPLRNSDGQGQSGALPTFIAAGPNSGANKVSQTNVLECRETVRVAETLLLSLLRPDDAAAVAAVRTLQSLPTQLSTRPADLPAQAITDFLVKHSSASPSRDTGDLAAHPALITNPEWLILYTADTPATSFQTYCSRIVTGLQLDPEQVVVALCLMRKVSCYTPLCTRSAHRAFLAAVLLASKLRLDVVWTLKHYARCGGVSTAELAAMEVAMLDILGFDVGVSTPEYIEMLYSLRQHCATMAYVKKRDWAAAAWGTMAEQIPLPTVELLRSEYANRTAATAEEEESQVGTFDSEYGSPLSNAGALASNSSQPHLPKTALLPTDPNRFGSVSNVSITPPAKADTVFYRYRYNGVAYPPISALVQSLLPKRWVGTANEGGKRKHRKTPQDADSAAKVKEVRPPPSWAERCATATASQNKRTSKTAATRPALPSSGINPSHPLLQGNVVGNAMVQQGQMAINKTGEVPVFMGQATYADPASGGPVALMYPEQLARHQQAYYPAVNYHTHANTNAFALEMQRAMQHSNESSVASLSTTGSAGTLHSNDSQFLLAPVVGLVPANYATQQPPLLMQQPIYQVPVNPYALGYQGVGYPQVAPLAYTSNQIPSVPTQASHGQWSVGHQQALQYANPHHHPPMSMYRTQ